MFYHNSIFGFLNNFSSIYQHCSGRGTLRTLYPPLKEQPTIKDLFTNFNFSDFSTMMIVGAALQFTFMKTIILEAKHQATIKQAYQKMKTAQKFSTVFSLNVGLYFALLNSRNRLLGNV